MSDIPNAEGQVPSPEGLPVQFRELGTTDVLSTIEASQIVERLGALTISDESVLAEHQRAAFNDIITEFRSGVRETLAVLPTGSGKTVLYVEIVKQLLDSAQEGDSKHRVVVLEPTVDLVNQTVGSISPDGKRRGFKGFAPELDVRPYHSKISTKERDGNLTDAEVLITTNNSFRNLIEDLDTATSKSPDEWRQEARAKRAAIPELETLRTNRRYEAKVFLREAFEEQEVDRLKERAEALLDEPEAVRLSSSEVVNLRKIIQLVDSDEPRYLILQKARAILVKGASEQVADAIKRKKETIEKAKATRARKEKMKKGEILPLDDPETDEILGNEDNIIEETEELTGYDKLTTEYLWATRDGRRISYYTLRNRPARTEYARLKHEASDAGAEITRLRNRANGAERMARLGESFAEVKFLVCDEAHRIIGDETWSAIRRFADRNGIAILGVTATDQYNDRKLTDYFQTKAHELTREAAIERQIVNSLGMFVHETHREYGQVALDASGEYDQATMHNMRHNHERNMLAVDYAKLLSEHGYYGIISAIPGSEGEHAVILSELLNQATITDPESGEQRPLRARYVLERTQNRQEYYDQFEVGDIDWLVFIDTIREGWDSDRAKALLNWRPTRSQLLAIQRLGRVCRTHAGAKVSVVVDVIDGIIGEDDTYRFPPVVAADVFDLDGVEQGHIVGDPSLKDQELFKELSDRLPYPIQAHHSRYLKALGSAMMLGTANRVRGWETYEALLESLRGFLPKEVLLQAAESEPPLVRTASGRKGSRLLPMFNIADVHSLHPEAPLVNPWKLFIDDDERRWISPEGIVQMFSKLRPELTAGQVTDSIRNIETESGQNFGHLVGRVQLSFSGDSARNGFTLLYPLEEVSERLVPVLKQN